jgi:hypothetical protein
MRAGIGWHIDGVAGGLSRLLHGVRGAEHDTTADLAGYLDLPVEALLPAPIGVPDVRRRRAQSLRPGRVTESLEIASQHAPI